MKLQDLEVAVDDYLDVFEVVDHSLQCEGQLPTTIRLHFIRSDFGGSPRVDHLAETLVTYISKFCFSASRRRGLSDTAQIRTFLEAKRLFRNYPTSGQPGELLTYFLIEAVLKAPQVVKKMLLTTNPGEERKGSDGLHVRWTDDREMLEVIFAESKLFQNFEGALKSAFKSINEFHVSTTKQYELDVFLNAFRDLDSETQEIVRSYLRGVKKDQCREVQVCFIGHDWDEYKNLTDPKRRPEFLATINDRYRAWAQKEMLPALNAQLANFPHYHLRLEFFCIPFKSVGDFRALFLGHLGFSGDAVEAASEEMNDGDE